MSYMLRFQLDENIPKLLKKWMVSRGHSAEYAEKGTKNGKLASLALDKGFILLSRDRGLSQLSLISASPIFRHNNPNLTSAKS